MHRTGLLLSIVVFVAVYSTVYCAPCGKHKVTSPRPTNLGLNNRVSSSSNTQFSSSSSSNTRFSSSSSSITRFSSSSSLNRGSSNIDLSTYKDVCKSCPSSANACEVVGESKGKQLYTTTKCMNGSRVISEKTKTSPNPSGAMVKTRHFESYSSSSSG